MDLVLQLIKKYYAVDAAQKMHGEIKLENIPLDDSKAYNLLCDLDVIGIFQMDNIKISKPILRKIQPNNIHEVAAVTALIRPGSGQVDTYIKAKNDQKFRVKIDPRIDRYLNRTYGVILFQEQR